MASITDDNFLVWNQGKNPVVNFNFMLRVELLFDLPCKSIRAFSREMEYEYIQEGGLNDYVHMRRKPISRPFTLEVERYVGVDYIDPMPLGAELVLPVLLIVARNHDQFIPFIAARTYVFTGVSVMKKTFGDLVADQSGLLVETTTLAYREMLCVDIPWSERGDNMFAESGTPPTQASTVDKTLEQLKAEGNELYERAKTALDLSQSEWKAVDLETLSTAVGEMITQLKATTKSGGELYDALEAAKQGTLSGGKSLEDLATEADAACKEADQARRDAEVALREKERVAVPLRREASAAEAEVQAAQTQFNALTQQQQAAQAKQKRTEQELQRAEKAQQTQKTKKKQQEQELSAAQKAQQEQETRQKQAEQELSQAQEAQQEPKSQKEQAEQTLLEAQRALDTLQSETTQQKQALLAAQLALETQQKQPETDEQALLQAQTEHKAAEEALHKAESKYSVAKKKFQEATDQLKTAEEKLRRADGKIDTATRKAAEAEGQLKAAEEKQSVTKTRLQETERLLGEADAQAKKAKQQLAEMKEQDKAAEQALKEAEQALQKAKDTLSEVEERRKPAEGEVSTAKTAFDTAFREYEAKLRAVSEARDKASDANRVLNEAQARFHRAERVITPLQNASNQLAGRKPIAAEAQKRCSTIFPQCTSSNQKLQAASDLKAANPPYQELKAASKQVVGDERQVRNTLEYMSVAQKQLDEAQELLPPSPDT